MMTNTEAVAIWKDLVAAKAPMVIKRTPTDFECVQPFVVVADERRSFVMGDFATVEAAERFCFQNLLPIKTFQLDQFSLDLQSCDHGYRDYDVSGHPTLRRACVPAGLRKGDTFNVYHGESSKSGAKWLGTLERSISAWLVEQSRSVAGAQAADQQVCAQHGQMSLRAAGSPEQEQAGTWHQCTQCTNSALLPSNVIAHRGGQ